MQPTGFGLVSLVTFLPLIGAFLLAFVPQGQVKAIKWGAIGIAGVTFLVSLLLLVNFVPGTYHFQMVEYVPWIQRAGIHYRVGIDGISLWLVLLTTFLTFIALWFSVYVEKRIKPYMIFMLILETAMLGVFVALDLIVFYVFFEATLIPMYFLIAIWGGARRAYASLKFFIYTFAGSIFMLIGMISLFLMHQQATGIASFSLVDIQAAVADGSLWAVAPHLQALLFWAFAIAFLVKCPAFPFHTWLPDAHVEAPTAGSVILAGVLLKMGTYGFLRFSLPLFPDVVAAQVVPIMVLAVIGIIYGAVVAAIQPDVKKLIAYSSVAHMGFVLIGIFSLTHSGLMGGTYQQLNHGISTGGLFLLVGLLYERRHTRMFKDYGGLKAQMPIFATLFLIMMLSSVGLPGTNGFIGEFLALMGAFQASYHGLFGLNVWFAVIAGFGVVLAAVYLLYMYQKLFYGPNDNPENRRLRDVKPWEIGMVGLLVLFVFWGGLYPNTFLRPMEASLGAVRMMALNPVGQRPTWANLEMEMDGELNLVQVGPRTQAQLGEPIRPLGVIAPAELHIPAAPTGVEAPVAQGSLEVAAR
jgi:NADH-quinone oxidoreductase subunit M